MPLTNAQKQQRARSKRDAKILAMTEALEEIRAILSGNTKPLALKILGVVDLALD